MQDFKQLKVWQKAHQLTLSVYRITADFPRQELYGLTSQLRRASSSISANLAEGCGRNGLPNWPAFVRSRWVQLANWSTTSCWPGI
ncbi:MAG: four helix bundle protein [Bryobacteraceae bacterium]